MYKFIITYSDKTTEIIINTDIISAITTLPSKKVEMIEDMVIVSKNKK